MISLNDTPLEKEFNEKLELLAKTNPLITKESTAIEVKDFFIIRNQVRLDDLGYFDDIEDKELELELFIEKRLNRLISLKKEKNPYLIREGRKYIQYEKDKNLYHADRTGIYMLSIEEKTNKLVSPHTTKVEDMDIDLLNFIKEHNFEMTPKSKSTKTKSNLKKKNNNM